MNDLNQKINQAFERFDEGNVSDAEELYEECLSMITDRHSPEYTQVLHGLGYVKAASREYDEARRCYNELITIALYHKTEKDHCIAVHQLGMVERMAKCYDDALKLFRLEAHLLEQYHITSPINWSANLYEQGMIALKMDDVDSAQRLMEESLELAVKSDDDICLGCSYRGLGEMYQVKREESFAKQSFHLAKKAFERAGDDVAIEEVEKLMQF